MSINKYLDASTAHITREDNSLLQQTETSEGVPGCYVYPYDCGYFISVYPDAPSEEEKKESGFSESFFKVLEYARKNGCTVLRLDADGDPIKGLKKHDWDNECPECGTHLINGPNKRECPNCGKFF